MDIQSHVAHAVRGLGNAIDEFSSRIDQVSSKTDRIASKIKGPKYDRTDNSSIDDLRALFEPPLEDDTADLLASVGRGALRAWHDPVKEIYERRLRAAQDSAVWEFPDLADRLVSMNPRRHWPGIDPEPVKGPHYVELVPGMRKTFWIDNRWYEMELLSTMTSDVKVKHFPAGSIRIPGIQGIYESPVPNLNFVMYYSGRMCMFMVIRAFPSDKPTQRTGSLHCVAMRNGHKKVMQMDGQWYLFEVIRRGKKGWAVPAGASVAKVGDEISCYYNGCRFRFKVKAILNLRESQAEPPLQGRKKEVKQPLQRFQTHTVTVHETRYSITTLGSDPPSDKDIQIPGLYGFYEAPVNGPISCLYQCRPHTLFPVKPTVRFPRDTNENIPTVATETPLRPTVGPSKIPPNSKAGRGPSAHGLFGYTGVSRREIWTQVARNAPRAVVTVPPGTPSPLWASLRPESTSDSDSDGPPTPPGKGKEREAVAGSHTPPPRSRHWSWEGLATSLGKGKEQEAPTIRFGSGSEIHVNQTPALHRSRSTTKPAPTSPISVQLTDQARVTESSARQLARPKSNQNSGITSTKWKGKGPNTAIAASSTSRNVPENRWLTPKRPESPAINRPGPGTPTILTEIPPRQSSRSRNDQAPDIAAEARQRQMQATQLPTSKPATVKVLPRNSTMTRQVQVIETAASQALNPIQTRSSPQVGVVESGPSRSNQVASASRDPVQENTPSPRRGSANLNPNSNSKSQNPVMNPPKNQGKGRGTAANLVASTSTALPVFQAPPPTSRAVRQGPPTPTPASRSRNSVARQNLPALANQIVPPRWQAAQSSISQTEPAQTPENTEARHFMTPQIHIQSDPSVTTPTRNVAETWQKDTRETRHSDVFTAPQGNFTVDLRFSVTQVHWKEEILIMNPELEERDWSTTKSNRVRPTGYQVILHRYAVHVHACGVRTFPLPLLPFNESTTFNVWPILDFYFQLFAAEHGVDPNVVFYTAPVLNAVSILGRILLNVLADHIGAFNASILASLSSVILILSMLKISTVASIIVFASVYGFFAGGGAFITVKH
ncbi:hypothetical protein C8J56DRAFT_1113490 [Mycena floridula]|nr:hypothetical protein C8J56DRAFT_1113490 [Mycena floridula]